MTPPRATPKATELGCDWYPNADTPPPYSAEKLLVEIRYSCIISGASAVIGTAVAGPVAAPTGWVHASSNASAAAERK